MSKNQNGKFGVQLKKVNVNNFSRIVAYIIDWYVATMVSSIPIVIITSIVISNKYFVLFFSNMYRKNPYIAILSVSYAKFMIISLCALFE